ncbi:MAG: histidinol-phosphate transaminase [Planctomycetota bacterium]
MSYQRPNIQRMTGYAPGEQPEDASVIKLNTNENPFPPCDEVMDTLSHFDPHELRRYPLPAAQRFCKLAAQTHNVAPENIIATNGGDELLRLAITTFVDPGQRIGTAEPSYSLYPVLADIHDAEVFSVDLNDDWLPPADLAARMNDAGAKITFIVNPHAPSGVLLGADPLATLAEQLDGVLLIDEAYVDFVDPALEHDTTPLVNRFDNVLILRTLSKGYSMAGLRFGYGIGSAGLIRPMTEKTKDSYNTDAVSQRLAEASLTHRGLAADTWRIVRIERDRLVRELAELGLTCPESHSNFVLASVPDAFAGGAQNVYQSLKDRGIFVRYFDQDRLRDKLRITVGLASENDALLSALRELA